MSSESLSKKYCSGLDANADASLNPDVLHLLLHLHRSEPDIEKSILVFLPTYYALQQQWIRLLSVRSTFKVHIFHRSIDTDEALQTMEVSKSGRKDEYHLECLKNVVNTQEPKAYHKPEEVWCASHNLVPAALNNISEMYDDIMSTLHRFRPSFMVKINPPMYLHPSEFLKLQKDFVPICMKCLNDSAPEVWDSSFSALTAIAKMVGMKPLERPL